MEKSFMYSRMILSCSSGGRVEKVSGDMSILIFFDFMFCDYSIFESFTENESEPH